MFHQARSLVTRTALGCAVRLLIDRESESFQLLPGTGSRAPAAVGTPKSLCLPFISVHSKRPAASRSLLQFTPTGPALFSGRPGGVRGFPRDKRCPPRPRRAPAPALAPLERALGAAAETGVAAALRACPAPCAALRTHPCRKIKCLPLMISNSSVWLMACKLPPVPSDLRDEAPRRLVL